MTDGAAEPGHDIGSAEGAGDAGRSRAERRLLVVSGPFTALLPAFVIWQGATTPTSAAPTATVAGTAPHPEGGPGHRGPREPPDVGLVVAVVEVDCDGPPPELTFEPVPADDRRTGSVRRPAGTGTTTATVSSWLEA